MVVKKKEGVFERTRFRFEEDEEEREEEGIDRSLDRIESNAAAIHKCTVSRQ